MTKEELTKQIEELEEALCYLETKISKTKKHKKSRKEEVREILEEGNRIFVGDIAKRLGITSRNVSSYLTYIRRDLRNEGLDHEIITDSKGRKYLTQ